MNLSYSPHIFEKYSNIKVGRDSSACVATRYWLEGTGIESRWGARFPAPVQAGLGAHSTSYTVGTESFPGVKRPGCDVYHPPSSSAEVEEIVELGLYPSLGLCGLF